MTTATITDWHGLYREKWTDRIHPDAVVHPAKFARALIRQIYQHAIEERWLQAGDSVLDCFGGVALGAFDAMRHGLHWTAVELEPRFVALGNQNIALWNERFAHRLASWGSARLLQGDSRKLVEVCAGSRAAMRSSPPYCNRTVHGHVHIDTEKMIDGKTVSKSSQIRNMERYSDGAGNLGNLPEGDRMAVMRSSPPFGEALSGGGINVKGYGDGSDKVGERTYSDTMHNSDGANLGALKASDADFQAVVCSPPFVESLASDNPQKRGGLFKDEKRANDRTLTATYGNSDGQLGAMPAGALITSPPFLEGRESDRKQSRVVDDQNVGGAIEHRKTAYGDVDGQLGNMPAGALVTSPPFEKGADGHVSNGKFKDPEAFARGVAARSGKGNHHAASPEAIMRQLERDSERVYGKTEGNIGNQSGETFWSASRLILEQSYQVLAPGAHAMFVVKDFIRKKQIVPFCEQWAELCEAVGFRLIHIHRAWLTEKKGSQIRLDGGEDCLDIERKSFFRRLAEKKGSPRIDYETVLCFKRI